MPPALLLAAQRAFIASDSFFLPAAVSPPLFFAGTLAAPPPLAPPPLPPLRFAQRAFAAVASFARVAADIGRRPRERLRDLEPREVVLPEPALPKIVDKRRSSEPICCLIESASVSFCRDKSISH